MSSPQHTVVTYKAAITGNVSNQEMLDYTDGSHLGGAGIEAGGRIDLGTATTADVTIKDQLGKTVYSKVAVVADVDIDPVAAGVVGPLTVTVANISNAAHTLTVYWFVKK